MKISPHWKVICETDSHGTKKKRIEYGADAAKFNLAEILAESEDALSELFSANIAYGHLPSGDFHTRVQYLARYDMDILVCGIVRRLVESFDNYGAAGWSTLFPTPSIEALPVGQNVAHKYGVDVWQLETPISLDPE